MRAFSLQHPALFILIPIFSLGDNGIVVAILQMLTCDEGPCIADELFKLVLNPFFGLIVVYLAAVGRFIGGVFGSF